MKKIRIVKACVVDTVTKTPPGMAIDHHVIFNSTTLWLQLMLKSLVECVLVVHMAQLKLGHLRAAAPTLLQGLQTRLWPLGNHPGNCRPLHLAQLVAWARAAIYV